MLRANFSDTVFYKKNIVRVEPALTKSYNV